MRADAVPQRMLLARCRHRPDPTLGLGPRSRGNGRQQRGRLTTLSRNDGEVCEVT